MPGSLLLGNDAYSDVSDASGRSVDSKTGGKKVSFNKAVRVKQYPWKPDMEVNTSEHLTLPSNRFWFKVYKNKHDSPGSYDYTSEGLKHNAWEDESMDCIHDSLAPIAEVEDQDIESPRQTNGILDRNGLHHKTNCENDNGTYEYPYHPTEPPVDYLDDIHSSSNGNFASCRQIWNSNELSNGRHNYNDFGSNKSNHFNGNGYRYETIKENDDFNSNLSSSGRHSRASINNDLSTRRSMRKLDNPNNGAVRERRSRSHDDYINNDSRFNYHRKADKSVSTEDLNCDNKRFSSTNQFFKGSRDIATQCYGTLTRNKNIPTINNQNTTSKIQTNSFLSNTERLNNFKSPKSRLNIPDEYNNNSTPNQKKDYSLEKFSSVIRPRIELKRANNFSTQTEQHQKTNNFNSPVNSKLSKGNLKPLSRTENGISDIMHRQANKSFNKLNTRSEFNSPSAVSKKIGENTNHMKESNTIGYLRGRQIPLSEMNPNTNNKFVSRSNIGLSQNYVSRNTDENRNSSMFPNRSLKSDLSGTKGQQSKRYLSPTNNPERRSFRNGSNSAKSYPSSYSEAGNSMIDWSLSGFQLAPKPDNAITSMSDSEYTVHRRPPLLMYIPGVSHHDRPAIEDDRMSALSDISRSELNDGQSSLGSTKDKIGLGDFRRRQSMREGKSKWMKWKSKS